MFWRKKHERILSELRPEQSFLVGTTETQFMFHLLDRRYYARKTASKDSRYGLVTAINGKKRYKETDLELGAEVEYVHPRLGREVSGGKVKSIAVK